MAAAAAEEALPRGNALGRGGDASSTSIVVATITFKWSSQNTSLVTCWEHCWEGSARCMLHHNQTRGTFDLSKDGERAGALQTVQLCSIICSVSFSLLVNL